MSSLFVSNRRMEAFAAVFENAFWKSVKEKLAVLVFLLFLDFLRCSFISDITPSPGSSLVLHS